MVRVNEFEMQLNFSKRIVLKNLFEKSFKSPIVCYVPKSPVLFTIACPLLLPVKPFEDIGLNGPFYKPNTLNSALELTSKLLLLQ